MVNANHSALIMTFSYYVKVNRNVPFFWIYVLPENLKVMCLFVLTKYSKQGNVMTGNCQNLLVTNTIESENELSLQKWKNLQRDV